MDPILKGRIRVEEEAKRSHPKVSIENKLNHKKEKNTLEDAGLYHEKILEERLIKESISGEPDFRNFIQEDIEKKSISGEPDFCNFADEERKKGGISGEPDFHQEQKPLSKEIAPCKEPQKCLKKQN